MAHSLNKVMLASATDKYPRLLPPGFRVGKIDLTILWQLDEKTASGVG